MTLFRLLTDFDGRIGLRQFWLGSALVALALFAIQKAVPHFDLASIHQIKIVAFANAFALFPWAALAAKRANDRGSTPLFGILLICAIVLPGQVRPALSFTWGPALDTIAFLAWVTALIDLGMMPSARTGETLAETAAGDKGAAWISPATQAHSPSTQATPSP